MKDWKKYKILPTDRYYIQYREKEGIDYEIADAIIILYKQENDETIFKTAGINFGVMNYTDDETIYETIDNVICDIVEEVDLDNMVDYQVNKLGLTRKQALQKLKNDFLKTKIRLSQRVFEIFQEID